MQPTHAFELVLGMLGAILVLHWLAQRFDWPPAIALLVGGIGLAFVPGVPPVTLDPEFVLALFLPPLLMDGAWHTALAGFRRHFVGIIALAIGAVAFTTLIVAVVTHWLMPELPWAACVALGAIVSPPDAVSARAVLQRARLPRRLTTLLEGESLLNDAAGLVIFRFAVAAALSGTFDWGAATGRFAWLAAGGVLVGWASGGAWLAAARLVKDDMLLLLTSTLVCWVAYFVGEALGASGVIATVTAGLVLGWKHHAVFPASVRLKGDAFWEVLTLLLEASVFILIGLSLRDTIGRAGGYERIVEEMATPVLAIVLVLVLARFVWIFGADQLLKFSARFSPRSIAPLGWKASTVMSWAGMRGVVTLAVALSLPESMPGRDFTLIVAFAVILATVVMQGSTLGLVIRWLGVRRLPTDSAPMNEEAAEHALLKAQLIAVQRLARNAEGVLIHPRLLETYTRRVALAEASDNAPGMDQRSALIAAHYDVILDAVLAGRAELLRLHRAHRIDDEILIRLERNLDVEEMGARLQKQ